MYPGTPPPPPPRDELLLALVDALNSLRDSWMTISLALGDVLTDSASDARDQTLTDVRCYLDTIQDTIKRDSNRLKQIPRLHHDDRD